MREKVTVVVHSPSGFYLELTNYFSFYFVIFNFILLFIFRTTNANAFKFSPHILLKKKHDLTLHFYVKFIFVILFLD